jgi:hypothetical protein
MEGKWPLMNTGRADFCCCCTEGILQKKQWSSAFISVHQRLKKPVSLKIFTQSNQHFPFFVSLFKGIIAIRLIRADPCPKIDFFSTRICTG